MEDKTKQPDLSQNVQRYQLAVDQAKVRLNLAVCLSACLMPARMTINTESKIGYNNKLKQAVGVNNEVNSGKKSWPEAQGRWSIKNQPTQQPPI